MRHIIFAVTLRTIAIVLALACAAPATAADSAVVLTYHRFGEDRYPSTNIRIEQFEAHLNHLQERDYAVVPLADVIAAVKDGDSLPDRAVAITIDDAYRSVYDVAFPLFRAKEIPFTVFVATDGVDEQRPAYMSWDQMREMAQHGATFANHGATHSSVIKQADGETNAERLARVRKDVEKGWRRLTEELNPLPGAFAYPYGEYDTPAANLLREMGYLSFGQQSGGVGPTSDSRALPRFPMAETFGDIDEFRTKVASLPMPVTNIDSWDPVTSNVQPSITVTLSESDARIGELACFVSGQGKVDVNWLQTDRFSVGPAKPFGKGRQRVNCTAPRDDGRYLWFSHPWIIQPRAQ
jgi:biofilm PGA synthesis lipoprotein PgaB